MNTCVNGINYYFKLDNADTSEDFYQKNWFISKLNPQNEEELEETNWLAGIWMAINKYGCQYNSRIEKQIERYSKLVYD